MLWTMTRERSSRLSVVVAQMPSFSLQLAKRCVERICGRTPLTLWTRITRVVRQPICFAQTTQMHDMVMGVL